jgi:hypothetical protein
LAFQAQQESFIELPRIIDPVVAGNPCAKYSRQVKQMIPISVVSRKSRDFVADDDPYLPERDLGYQALETAVVGTPAARKPLIFIDDVNPCQRSTQAPGTLDHLPLIVLAFLVLGHLLEGGLADIHIGGALQMRCGDFDSPDARVGG